MRLMSATGFVNSVDPDQATFCYFDLAVPVLRILRLWPIINEWRKENKDF